MRPEDVIPTLTALGFGEADARTLADHFLDAEARGKRGHGLSRVEWLATMPVDVDPAARPKRLLAEPGFERWDGNGALGYLTLAAVVEAQLATPPKHARVVVAQRCFPTGALGYWARNLAEEARTSRRWPEADRDEPACNRDPQLGRRPARERRLDGPGDLRRRAGRRRLGGRARSLRRRARAQGV